MTDNAEPTSVHTHTSELLESLADPILVDEETRFCGQMRDGDTVAFALREYIAARANPDRVGCPTFDQLAALSSGKAGNGCDDGLFRHLGACRECLLELRTLLDLAQSKAEERGEPETGGA